MIWHLLHDASAAANVLLKAIVYRPQQSRSADQRLDIPFKRQFGTLPGLADRNEFIYLTLC